MNTYDDNDGALAVALADLADTMPDDPNRVDGIHARARRLRTRRRATRAGVGVLVGAATIAGIIAIRPGPSSVSTIPASPSTDQAPALPACSTLPPPTIPPSNASPSADEASKAAAARASRGSESAVNGMTGVKGHGVVTAVTDSSISVTLTETGPGMPADVTAAFTAKTSYVDGSTEVTDRPSVAVGDQVALGAVTNDSGGYDLMLLNVHPPAPDASTPATGEITDAKKAAGAGGDGTAAPDADFVKGTATIAALQAGSATLDVKDGPLAGQGVTATLAPDIVYTVGSQKCVDPTLAAGQTVGFLLVRDDGGAYTLQQVALFG